MRQFIILVGNIGTGKTYYSKNYLPNTYKIVRPDDFIGDNDQITSQFFNEVESGLENNKSIVIDAPNLDKAFRNQLQYFTNKYKRYKKIIIDFGPGSEHSLNKLIIDRPYRSRAEWTKEHNDNFRAYEIPTSDEGYDEIITIRNNFV